MSFVPAPVKTNDDLEVGRLLQAIALRTRSPLGRAAALALSYLRSAREIEERLIEIEEVRALTLRAIELPLEDVDDVGPLFGRAAVRAVLSVTEIRAVHRTLAACNELGKFLRKQRDALPRLSATCVVAQELGDLVDTLGRALGEDGALADDASPRLAELREQRRSAKRHITERLNDLLKRFAGSLSDNYWTERDGRFVLPVRSDAHERFPGIVHAASAAGATLFVEPRAVVALGNRLKVVDAQIEDEEQRILGALTQVIAENAEITKLALVAYARADVRQASAGVAELFDWRRPALGSATDGLHLPRARHPLLQIEGVKVVPSDLDLARGCVLVLSGPNAGGKTVALKMCGLLALMVRLGLPIPTGDGAVVGLYDEVLTEIGDHQSLSKNLSTFSAHIESLAAILERANQGTLVLLDEVASGTDPREGEALAAALLSALSKAGATVVCTTHYEALKVIAAGAPEAQAGRVSTPKAAHVAFQNASVGFDLERLLPTFEITQGIPGPSAALAVARRFGIAEEICRDAESRLETATHDMSKLLADLANEKRLLGARTAELEKERAEIESERAALVTEQKRFEARDERAVQRESEALLAAVKRAREELRMAEVRMKSAELDAKELARLSAVVDEVSKGVAIGGALEPPRKLPATDAIIKSTLVVGGRVFVPKLRTEANVLEILASGQVRVAAGPMKLLVQLDELRTVARSESKAQKPRPMKPRTAVTFDAASDPDVPVQTSDNTVDLRGLRAHEAVSSAERFLDECLKRGLAVAFIIHGHGLGALRQSIREMLETSPYVQRSRPGGQREGGDGVTVAWLR